MIELEKFEVKFMENEELQIDMASGFIKEEIADKIVEDIRTAIDRRAHNVAQILAFETHAKDILLGKAQIVLDIIDHFGSSRSRKC